MAAVISTADLADLLSSDEKAVVLETSWDMKGTDYASEFQKARIACSHRADSFHGATSTPTVPKGIPDGDKFQEYVRSFGIDVDTHIVLIDRVPDFCGYFSTARLWWTLKYFGHENVSVVDGGFLKWVKEDRKIVSSGDDAVSDDKKCVGDWVVKFKPEWRRSFDDIHELIQKGKVDSVHLFDNRPPPVYNADGGDTFHVPGASNLCFMTALDKSIGIMRPKTELSKVFANVTADKPIVNYCNSGQTACIAALAMVHAGFDNVSVFNPLDNLVRSFPIVAMPLNLGDKIDNFVADTTHGRIRFHEWLGDSWCILFSHPADFTPVCTTELCRVAQLLPQFAQRNVKVIALSCDSVSSHREWIADVESYCGNKSLSYPIIADKDRSIAIRFGMLDPVEKDKAGMPLTCRAVFFIDPKKTLRSLILYPATTGRLFDEMLRVIDSLQLTEKQSVATPADWRMGDSVMVVPSMSDTEANRVFSNVQQIAVPSGKNYLRLTKAKL